VRLKKKDDRSKIKNNQPLSLKSNSLWNLLGSLIHALTQWGILISIAKLGSPEMVGVFTLALAITAPLVLLYRFNLRSVVVSDGNNEYSFDDYYSLRVVSTFIFIITMIIIALFYIPDWEITLVIIIFSLSRAVESISDILHGKLQQIERMDITAKSRIYKGIIALFIFSIIMFLFNNLVVATSAYFISWLVILIYYDFPKTSAFEQFKFKFNKKEIKILFLLSIPLGIAQLINSLNLNLPRYLLEYYHDPKVLGFLGAMIYIVNVGNNFIIAVNGAIMPRLSKYFTAGNIKKYLKLAIGFILFIIAAGLIGIIIVRFLGKEILTLLYTAEYGAYKEEFFYLTIMGLLMYISQVIGLCLTTTRTFKIQPYINFITLIIIAVTSYLFIPENGIMGAIMSLVIGMSAQLFIRLIILIIVLNKNIRLRKLQNNE